MLNGSWCILGHTSKKLANNQTNSSSKKIKILLELEVVLLQEEVKT